MNIIAVIPARYQSSRFPGKPLAIILDKPMIQWVYEAISQIGEIKAVYVATDDERIASVISKIGGNVIMTGACTCGSERVAEACRDLNYDIALNIQGDEPMMRKEMVLSLIHAFDDKDVEMATLKKEIFTEADINNPNIAKLMTDCNNNAIYFSRSTVPYNRDKVEGLQYYKHIGIYGYTKEFLEKLAKLPPSKLELAEQLEQLRVLENGYKIRVVESQYESIGVDLPEHIARVEYEMRKGYCT